MKKTLLIVGNGFDLAHGLPTKYKNFKEWMEKEQKEAIIDKALEECQIVSLCEQMKKFNINVSVSEIREYFLKGEFKEFIYHIYKVF